MSGTPSPEIAGALEALGVASGPGSREPSPAVSALRASIPNAAELIALTGDRYSPNLRRWLKRNGSRSFGRTPKIYRDRDNILFIGEIDDERWFSGSRLWRVLCVGGRAEVYAYPGKAEELTLIEGFWERYAAIGRCAIDVEHGRYWIGDDTRWAVDGNTRTCLWCGDHTQHLRRWTETKARERWEPASAIEAGTGETGTGSTAEGGESAVPKADAKNGGAS